MAGKLPFIAAPRCMTGGSYTSMPHSLIFMNGIEKVHYLMHEIQDGVRI